MTRFGFTAESTVEDLFLSLPARPLAVDAQAAWKEWKAAKGCARCGYRRTTQALHAAHIDPTTALRTRWGVRVLPANALKARGDGFTRYAWRTFCHDISGVIILCATCHVEYDLGIPWAFSPAGPRDLSFQEAITGRRAMGGYPRTTVNRPMAFTPSGPLCSVCGEGGHVVALMCDACATSDDERDRQRRLRRG